MLKRWWKRTGFELLAVLLVLLGWILLTAGVYLVVPHDSVLYISGGLLALGFGGWRVVGGLLWDGVYAAIAVTDEERQAAGKMVEPGSAGGNKGERRDGRRSTLPAPPD